MLLILKFVTNRTKKRELMGKFLLKMCILLFAFGSMGVNAMAESTVVSVLLKSGITENHTVTEDGKIYFDSDNFVIDTNGIADDAVYPIVNISKVLFAQYAGVSSLGTDEVLAVYPNPAKEQIFISGASEEVNVEIYTAAGVKIFSVKREKNEPVDVSSLPSGVYMLKIGDKIIKFSKL